jgi:hypothetical protein
MNQQQWEIFFPQEKRTWEEFKQQYDLRGLGVTLEPRKEGKKKPAFIGLFIAVVAVLVMVLA